MATWLSLGSCLKEPGEETQRSPHAGASNNFGLDGRLGWLQAIIDMLPRQDPK